MSEPVQDQRNVTETVSATQAHTVIQSEIENRFHKRRKLHEELLQIDAEIAGLRTAQDSIKRLTKPR